MFPEYSVSKRVMVNPDTVYDNSARLDPMFDLIIGTQIMERLGVILNLNQYDKYLLMRYIRNLQSNNSQKNVLANSYFSEPAATIFAI